MSIRGFFETLLDRLFELFVPNSERITAQFNDFKATLESKFNLHFSSLEALGNVPGEPVEDVEGSYNFGPYVGSLNVKFFDSSPLTQALLVFRPIIRGFIFFLLIIFNIKQFMSFIGQAPGISGEPHGNNGGDSDDS